MSQWSEFYSTTDERYSTREEMKYKAINLVNHKLDILLKNGSMFQYKTESSSLKLNKVSREVCKVDAGIPIVQNVYLHDDNLMPPMRKGVFYIVPKVVAELYKNVRSDFVYPGTNPNPSEDRAVIENGKVTKVRQFRLPNELSMESEVIEMV